MTAVANPPSFANINRPAWGSGSQTLNGSSNHDDVRSMFAPRKSMQRTNSSSSIASNASTASSSSTVTVIAANGNSNGGPVGGAAGIGSITSSSPSDANTTANGLPITTLRKRPLNGNAQWSANRQDSDKQQADFLRGTGGAVGNNGVVGRQQQRQLGAGPNGVPSLHQLPPFQSGAASSGTNGTNGIMARQQAAEGGAPPQAQPVLYLVSLNGTFERKTITVPFQPDTLRIGRQTNKNTTPNTVNGFFDSKVLSRQHAEIYADRQGTIWIRDIKSSNGTFVNGTRLSAENRESDPHELQTNDHLELGIDIVSEDQKSVVHHKVAAKVEHAGFIKTSNNLLDMNFGDLDPANGAMLAGSQLNGMPFRGRTGSQASLGPAGRMAPTSNMAAAQNNGLALQRGLWLTGPSTEAIVKKIHQEMRNAKQQSQDLQRTQEFIHALLSKDDIRNEPHKNDAAGAAPTQASQQPQQQQSQQPQQLQIVNGNSSISFRADPKARFSDPPAPPPQQPLPEKPDVPSLKRLSTERPKSGSIGPAGAAAMAANANSTSPIRPDVMGQVMQLNDALNTAKREIATHISRVRELEEKLHSEQEARRYAEELTHQLELMSSVSNPATKVDAAPMVNGAAKGPSEGSTHSSHSTRSALEDAFSPSTSKKDADSDTATAASADEESDESDEDRTDAAFRARIDSMMTEMEGMKRQLQVFKERAEKAEAERDADRETLAEMVQRIRRRDEEDAAKKKAQEEALAAATSAAAVSASALAIAGKAGSSDSSPALSEKGSSSRSLSPRGRGGRGGKGGAFDTSKTAVAAAAATGAIIATGRDTSSSSNGAAASHLAAARHAADEDDSFLDGGAALSRSDTITPASLARKVGGGHGSVASKVAHDPTVLHGIPYASMVGVVLLGMGLMAYINGWQPAPRLEQ
ncbi:hypothetical protein SCUCBS95973_007369 [Sporothrix curviconia]|uniref:FHA domain-containing protein n=1 Tax=Sporothrix curviconia TaxID=1260050 RepID=A0ABP0CE00_9PEZI